MASRCRRLQGGLRRSEAAALRWADVQDAADGRGIVVYVRQSKTDQDGTAADVRYLKNGCAAALRQLRDRITVQRSGLRPDATETVLGGLNGQRRARAHPPCQGQPRLPARSSSVRSIARSRSASPVRHSLRSMMARRSCCIARRPALRPSRIAPTTARTFSGSSPSPSDGGGGGGGGIMSDSASNAGLGGGGTMSAAL